MKRTRKWAFVEQEATRLAGLGLSASEIGKHIGVDSSTVRKWIRSGKLVKVTRSGGGSIVVLPKSPEDWAKDVRGSYALDATDDQLVTMAELCLLRAHDPNASDAVRFAAMGRFQAIVKQLALVARNADEPAKPDEKPQVVREPRRTGTDPRAVLMAVVK